VFAAVLDEQIARFRPPPTIEETPGQALADVDIACRLLAAGVF
jgi:hypothetical protein